MTPSQAKIDAAYMLGYAFCLGYQYALHPDLIGVVRFDLANDASFKEDEHPRDKDGKFKSGKSSPKLIEDIYGPEITLSKPDAKLAIKVLLKHQSGHIKDAVRNKEIGNIDLIWGDSKRGLKHIIESRKKHGQSPEYTLRILPEILEKAKRTTYGNNDERNAVNDYLVYCKDGICYRAVITKHVRNSKDPNNKLRFVLTAMQITDQNFKGSLIKR